MAGVCIYNSGNKGYSWRFWNRPMNELKYRGANDHQKRKVYDVLVSKVKKGKKVEFWGVR